MALYINMKVLENEDGSGSLELWKRGSITCTHILGTLKFANSDERDVLLDMLMKGHPEVSFMEKLLFSIVWVSSVPRLSNRSWCPGTPWP